MILTVDPGRRYGLAYGDGTSAPTVITGTGYEAFLLALDHVPAEAQVFLEEPFQQILGVAGHKGGVQQLRTYVQQRDALIRRFCFVNDLPVLKWQAIHAGHEAEEDPKCRSLAVVQAKGWVGPWQAKGGRRDGEACDAGAMYAYVLSCA